MATLLSMMVGEDLRDDDRDALAGRNVQEFIGAVRVRVLAETFPRAWP